MSFMFYKCKSLKEIKISNIDGTNAKEMISIDGIPSKTKKIIIEKFKNVNKDLLKSECNIF